MLHPQTNTDPSQAEAVLQFWFDECRPWQWFRQRDDFDALISERFGSLVEFALAGQLERWGERSNTGLALVLLLDHSRARCIAAGPRPTAVMPKLWSSAKGPWPRVGSQLNRSERGGSSG